MWLIFAFPDDDGSHIGFEMFSIVTGAQITVRFITTGEPFNKYRVIGSIVGRVVVEDALSRIYLMDPLTNIFLPYPCSLFHSDPSFGTYRKVALVIEPESKTKWAVVLRNLDPCIMPQLVFAPMGASNWTNLTLMGECHVHDITVLGTTLFALNALFEIREYDLLDLERRTHVTTAPDKGPELEDEYLQSMHYLGVIFGRITLLRMWEAESLDRKFEVFWLLNSPNNEPLRWERTMSLLGHAILLGNDGFLVVPEPQSLGLIADNVYHIVGSPTPGEWCICHVDVATNIGQEIFIQSLPQTPSFWWIPFHSTG